MSDMVIVPRAQLPLTGSSWSSIRKCCPSNEATLLSTCMRVWSQLALGPCCKSAAFGGKGAKRRTKGTGL